MKKGIILFLLPVLMGLTGCGKNNIFSWAHKPGENTSAQALEADAVTALQDKDYTKAVEYYSQVIAKEPNNSEAIYGYSAARLAESGLVLGPLVANLVRQQSSAPSRLAPALSSIAKGQSLAVITTPNTNLLPEEILAKALAIEGAVNDVIPLLARIVKGQGDGRIAPDNPDVNLNLAFCLVLRSALRVRDAVDFSTDYETITVKEGLNLDLIVRASAKDIVSAYQRMKVVAAKLGANAKTIANINSDVATLFDKLRETLKNPTDDGNPATPAIPVVDLDTGDVVTLTGDYL
ncbi:MAG: hypothetical protein A2285_01395 [Elusimicrobia bacterium RIFOXYA12_FULL_57_11]|nr:MAG: hypothetical protein A2285_01395 [Elusimicrobia bacterium RIFOXYA12_FULL_57_11]